MANRTLKNRVGFFRRWDFYSPMLDPIYSQLKNSFPCCMTSDLKEMIEFRPDIIVLSDHHGGYFYKYIPNALIIMTRHNCLSKNYIHAAMPWYDIFCVSSEWIREDCIKKGMKPQIGYFVSGFPPMDQVFESLEQPADSFRSEIFPDDGPTLLYAPTWNPPLNSADILGNRWVEMLRASHPSLNILIKPHPHIPDENEKWMEMWRNMASGDPKTCLIEDTHSDVYPYFKITDIALGDASSVIFFFLALNRPIILVNNPKRFASRWFDPNGPEWRWRDMGIEIDAPEELPAAVTRSLQNPGEKAAERNLYRERLFGNYFDGKASARIANLVRTLLRPDEMNRQWVESAWKVVGKRAARQQKLKP